MILTAEPMPRHYSTLVIQVVSMAYGNYVDYRVLGLAVTETEADDIIDDLVRIYPKREFRLVRRTISDEVIPG